ncbi:MAG: TonB-dependent receptor [Methylovulum sp.]|uniref:TonB-dependent receptor n=1 Tax=Methylovulum sp. TaxID=1916980 RepID=UPI0026236A19|nr:TonB-dependent receptor [Methylovulum sp.]MDD2723012.1 TonB-dependent receptor [Methylovulum sp.]MDD5125222.1 TonB-dependent receptor [Methylovulum sp.]
MNKKLAMLCLSAFGTPVYAETSSITELEQIVVTAPLQENVSDTTLPVTILSDEELRLKVGHSIGETLKNELGITSQSFGPGVGTPVIRGQSGPRVRVLNNGIGSNDVSAISPDHATSVEPLLAERIEVLRGPATLLYGSGAIGGVVNVIDNRIPEQLPEKLLGGGEDSRPSAALPTSLWVGALEQRFDSVSDETATTMKLEGGKDHIAYHIDGFFRDRGNVDIGGNAIDINAARQVDPTLPDTLQNTNGFIANSSSDAISGSAGLSLIGEPGFAGVSINRLENNYGIAPDGTGGEITRIALKQSKYDLKSELKNPFAFAESLRMKLGYTDYQHTEIPNGQEAAFFTNKTYESRLELTHKPIAGLHGALGFQAIASDFAAIDKSSNSVIVPQSFTNSYGVFAVESFKFGMLNNQLGFRVEDTTIAPEGLSNLNYVPVSASASSLWKINDNHSVNLAMTRSQRAPQVQELLANGYHDATRSFEIGNIKLHEETSYNLDLGYKFNANGFRAEFDLFHNWANDYIYQQRSGVFVTEEGGICPVGTPCSPVVESRQANATFMGYEGKLIFPLIENHYGLVDLTLFSDYTRGQFVAGGDVPRMPPLRFGFQLDHIKGDWNSNLRLTRGEAQDRPGDFDTATAGYVQLNLSTQYLIKQIKDVDVMVFAKANNLLDENIRNSTSYLRNFAPEPGRGAEIGLRVNY